jgi:DNA-binding response OmpR family regulator
MSRALIVDDDESICEVLRDLADSLGHTSDMARDVQSARNFVNTLKYDYIILDLSIPMNLSRLSDVSHGLEFIREIHNSETNATTPIIAMSGQSSRRQAFETYSLGAVSFIDKPFDNYEVAKEIKRLVNQNSSEEANQPECRNSTDITQCNFCDAEREMIIDGNGIKICGVEVYRFSYNPRINDILQSLSRRQGNGYVRLKAKDMKSFGTENEISKAVKNFRDTVSGVLLKSRNMICGRDDIIGNQRGYFLRENVRVRFTDGGSVE